MYRGQGAVPHRSAGYDMAPRLAWSNGAGELLQLHCGRGRKSPIGQRLALPLFAVSVLHLRTFRLRHCGACHTPGVANGAADTLSRNNVGSFFSQILCHASLPRQVLPYLVLGLCVNRPAWTSREWTA